MIAEVGVIISALQGNERVQQFGKDMLSGFVDWIEPLFLKRDPEVVAKIKSKPSPESLDEETVTQFKGVLGQVLNEEKGIIPKLNREVSRFSGPMVANFGEVQKQINIETNHGTINM